MSDTQFSKPQSENQTALIVYRPTPDVSVSFATDLAQHTIWATQRQIAQVFNLDVRTVNHHIQNFKTQRGDKAQSGIRNFEIPTNGGVQSVEHYNMTVITFIGFRAQATERTLAFQDWVGEQLDALIAQQNRALDPLDQLKMTVIILEQQREEIRLLQAQQTETRARMEHVEDTLDAADGAPQMMTVAAYAKWKNLRLADGELSSIGRKATAYSNAHGYPIGKIPHGTFGMLNKYHVDVLKLLFSQRTLFEGRK